MKLWMERKDVNKKSEWYRCVKRKKKVFGMLLPQRVEHVATRKTERGNQGFISTSYRFDLY